MKKFSWGRVIDRFTYNFDGDIMEVVKYHPWKTKGCTIITGSVDETAILYSCEELNESCDLLQQLIISWIAYRNLGLNQHHLVSGIARALEVKK